MKKVLVTAFGVLVLSVAISAQSPTASQLLDQAIAAINQAKALLTTPPTPPAAVDCVVSWTMQSAGPWGSCLGGQQVRTETWVATVTTAACPASPQTRTGTQVCSSTPPAVTTNYFSWDVESDSYTTCCIGTQRVNYYTRSSRSTDTAHRGASSLKLTVIGNDGGNQQLGADTINWNALPFNVTGSTVYYRWWMKLMPGFKWGNGTAKTKASRVIGSSTARVYTGYVQKSGFNLGECDGNGCVDPGPVIAYDMSTKADGQWHEYVVLVKVNSTASSSDAQFTVWVDATQVGSKANFRVNKSSNNRFNEAWGAWMVSPYFQLNGTSTDGGTMYLDDFSADSGWNSLIASGPQ